jgi:hypothetical protein
MLNALQYLPSPKGIFCAHLQTREGDAARVLGRKTLTLAPAARAAPHP